MNSESPAFSDERSQVRKPLLVRAPQPRRGGILLSVVAMLAAYVALRTLGEWLYPSTTAALKALPSPIGAVIYIIVLYPFCYLILGAHGRRIVHRIRQTAHASRHKSTSEFVAAITRDTPRVLFDKKVPAQLVASLREFGCLGEPVLVHWDRPPPPIQSPLDVPIEPVALDETDSAFHALEVGQSLDFINRTEQPARSESDTIMPRSFYRRHMNTGLWIGLGLLAIGITLQVIGSIMMRRLQGGLALSVLLMAVVSLPLLLRGFVGTSWLLVPGGLVMRKAQKKKMGSDVHLFRSGMAVLLIRPTGKRLWLMMVGDESEFGMTQVSDRELTMLLRAWLSPIPPPTVERLVDLT